MLTHTHLRTQADKAEKVEVKKHEKVILPGNVMYQDVVIGKGKTAKAGSYNPCSTSMLPVVTSVFGSSIRSGLGLIGHVYDCRVPCAGALHRISGEQESV